MTKRYDNGIEVEIYDGGNLVFLIRTGLGGSVKGYEGKYETMANNARKKHNATVFVATTPSSMV